MRWTRFAFLLLALFAASATQAGAIYVYGKVVNEQGLGVSGVTVTAVREGCQDCRYTAITNEYGVYVWAVFPGPCGYNYWIGGCNAQPITQWIPCDQAYEWVDRWLVCRRFPPPPPPNPNDPGSGNP